MRILLTGVDGYIGSVVAPRLLAAGHQVRGLDTGYYREGWLYSAPASAPRFIETLNKDLRRIERSDLAGIDAVVHLAELSNDPLGETSRTVTRDINHQGSVKLAALAREVGIGRFVYASSCSVYGIAKTEVVDERSPVNPLTEYAKCKVNVERDLTGLATHDFCPVFLRNATAYGPSPRMRFDIVLNNLSGLAWTTGRIAMTSDGTPWRPLVHVDDIATAILCALDAPAERVRAQVFNVGRNEENYRVREIAGFVGEAFPKCEITFGKADPDNRSYKVNFDKISTQLPGFRCRHSARDGAFQLHELFERIRMDAATFEFRAYTRLKQLQYLIATSQIDQGFYWTH